VIGLELVAARKRWRVGLLALMLGAPLTLGPGAAVPAGAEGWQGAAVQPGMTGGGCGTGWMGQGPTDQRFIVMMIPHHEGAIAMADLALNRARRPEIRALATRIKVSQTSENDLMRRWYRQWYGQEVPAPTAATLQALPGGPGGAMGMGMGMGGMGMNHCGATSLNALAPGPNFERGFLDRMIHHHQMGVMMAAMALGTTQHPELRQLQEAMVRVQSEEIRQMVQWSGNWYGQAP